MLDNKRKHIAEAEKIAEQAMGKNDGGEGDVS